MRDGQAVGDVAHTRVGIHGKGFGGQVARRSVRVEDHVLDHARAQVDDRAGDFLTGRRVIGKQKGVVAVSAGIDAGALR